MSTSDSHANSPLSDDQQWALWAAQAQSGDQQAYRQLLGAILPYVQNTLKMGLANIDWVEDIAQEVLLSVHKSLHTYSAKKPFKPWLRAIINFRRTDYLRKIYRVKKRKEALKIEEDILQSAVTNPAFAGEYKDIERALSDLPERQRRIFERVKIQGFTAKEVAEELDMNENAVKVSAHRTMKKLKDYLA